jgi:type I restriction enzyme M protein
MLDNETKRRIDTARDILVGKLPDPKSQVEQITIALIYKFMDDMDAQAVEYGGEPSFFVGEYEKYGWRKLFAANLSGHERLALYGEAIVNLNQNPHLPQLFRDIFKNAYLPYRDPETLALFLKIINEFKYDHSERLGDAFEYLLSVLGSQGDAGQFRTPRHIIDFIVKTLAPKKNETVCDPACGTAGFLISSYKYILENNKRNTPGDTLTPDERRRLMTNFVGYDISPDMVRLSLVNLYLHGFPSPTIHEYDSLTSEDRWSETFDIVMANPPFMSPKGGIKPHKKFSINANRSEVLFVDYIAEHIHPTHGRAGIIVPEGIIFQSAGAYRDLRKMLVDKAFLYAVVSLPAGVFQPYSGVKTSVLLMDKTLAGKTDKVLFVKIQNDGFGLGAQRREQATSDLPDTLNLIRDFQQAVLQGDTSRFAGEDLPLQAVAVEKTQIAANGDYNLSGDRYRTSEIRHSKFEIVRIGDICQIERGGSPRPINDYFTDDGDGINWIKIGDVSENAKYITSTKQKIKSAGLSKTRIVKEGDFILSNSMSFGRPYIVKITGAIHDGWLQLRIKNSNIINPDFLYCVLRSDTVVKQYSLLATGGVVNNLNSTLVSGVTFPLPPLSIQKEIVEKIEGFQRIIDGAKQVIENYKPQIDISPDWEMVELGDADTEIIDGDRGVNYPSKEDFNPEGYCLFLNTKNVRQEGFLFNELEFITKEKDESLRKGKLKRNDVVMTTRGTIGNVALYDLTVPFDNIRINSGMLIFRPKQEVINSEYLFTLFKTQFVRKQLFDISSGSAQPQLPIRNLISVKIPLPPLEVQQEIVTRIEREQSLVNSNKELIKIFEAKIKDEINKLWEE